MSSKLILFGYAVIYFVSLLHRNEGVEQGESIFLINAVNEKNMDSIKWLLLQGAFLDVKDGEGRTPLMHAVTKPDNDVVITYLLDQGADPNLRDNRGMTAFHLSAENGVISSLKLLYERVPNEDRDDNGRSALHHAVLNNHQKVVQFLLDKGMDPYIRDNDGLTIMHLAAISGQIQFLRDFKTRSYNLEVTCDNGTSLILASLFDNFEVAKFLIDCGVNVSVVDSNMWSPLHAASYSGNVPLIKILVNRGAKIDEKTSDGKTPLYIAVERGHLNATEYLYLIGSNISTVDNNNNTLMHAAAKSGCIKMLTFLAENDMALKSLNMLGWTPIITAALENHSEAIKYLISKGADVNFIDGSGYSVMSFAASTGNLELIKFVSENSEKVKFNMKNSKGQTLLHFASESNSIPVLNFLIHAMADEYMRENKHLVKREITHFQYWKYYKIAVNQRDNEGKTVAYYASEQGNTKFLQELSRWGANYSIPTVTGDTVLHVASRNNDIKVLGVLLLQDFNIDMKNENGETAIFQAAELGNLETLKFLIDSEVNLYITDDRSRTVMHVAAGNGRTGIVKELINRFPSLINSQDNLERSPLWYAIDNNQSETINLLRNSGAEYLPSIDILKVVENGQIDLVKHWFIGNYVCNFTDVLSAARYDKKSLIHLAVKSGSVSTLNEIFKHKCFLNRINKLDNQRKTPAWYAATEGKIDILSKLEKSGGFIKPVITLPDAVELGYAPLVKHFIANGGDVDEKFKLNQYSILHRAILRGLFDVATVLIEAGANIESPYAENNTPLHVAVDRKHCSIVKLLIDRGAKINVKNLHGKTPLDFSNNSECTRYLLEKGAKKGYQM